MKQVKFRVSGHFLENAWREWAEIWFAAVSGPLAELISLWSRSGDFSNFCAILTLWNGSNLGFPGICWKIHRGNGLKFCMLVYPDNCQNWSDYGNSLYIFLILMLFWLSETGKIWVSRHFGHALWIFLIMVTLWLKFVIFEVSGHYLENVWEYMSRGGRRHISDALRRVLSSFSQQWHIWFE